MHSGTIKSSGVLNSDTVIDTGRGIWHSILITSGGAAGGVVTLYDNASAASGNELVVVEVGSGVQSVFINPDNVRYVNGLYFDTTVADVDAIVYFG